MSDRIAYEELKPGDVIQEGDEWWPKDGTNKWQGYHRGMFGRQVLDASIARRPHNITRMLTEFANQAEVLAEVRIDEKRLFDDLELLRSEYVKLQDERDEARNERDLARAEVARLSTEMWARKPLEDRVAALTDEVTQLRAERQEWIDRCNAESVRALRLSEQLSAAEVAVKSAQRARDELQRQVDELREQQSPVTPADQLSFYDLTEKRIASLEDDLSQVRADRDKLQGLIDDLLDEPTARQVQDMLRTWATELDWSADCFDSEGRDQINSLQRILIAVIERIEGMINPEATSAND